MVGKSDIVYVFSGGSVNADFRKSLGGDPSSVPILEGLNNLWDNVTEAESLVGLVDYRCFYLFNNNFGDTFWNCVIYNEHDTQEGSTIEVGLFRSDEVQRLTVQGNVTNGSLTMSYDDSLFTFVWDSNLAICATNLRTAINSIPQLSNVSVEVSQGSGITNFVLVYSGDDANRFHPLLGVTSNNLSPQVTVTTSRVSAGSPINAIATLIDTDATVPTGVTFSTPTPDEHLVIGHLRPGDGFAVWLRRTTRLGTMAIAGDGFEFVCSGTAFL